MPDVTINIQGRGSSGANNSSNNGNTTLPPRPGATSVGQPNGATVSGSPTPQPTNNGMPAVPTYDRLAQDIRREILSRGCLMVPGSSNYNQLMTTVTQNYSNKANQALDQKYDAAFNSLDQQRKKEKEDATRDIEARRRAALANTSDPYQINSINNNFDKVLNRKLANIDKKYDPKIDQLEESAAKERAQVDKDIAKIAQELLQEMKRGNPNSYMAKLRTEMGEARWKRDNAETEEEVRDASREITDIQKRMSKATNARNPFQKFNSGWGTFTTLASAGMQAYNTYLQNEGREIGIVNQAANGDAFGAMQANLERMRASYSGYGGAIGMGVGGLIGGIAAAAGSFGIGTGAGAGLGAAAGGGVGTWIGNTAFNLFYGDEVNQAKLGSLWADQEKRLAAYNQLALITRGNGNVGAERDKLFNQFNTNDTEGYASAEGLTIHDLGYTNSDFSIQAAQRAKSRGYYSGNAVLQAMREDILEKAYNMNQGSLSQLGSYDRYRRSNDATQDVANLIASLESRNVWGMSGGQHLRTNEFIGYQTQLMEMQKRYMMNPSSEYAQRQLLAAQNVYGNALDSRGIQAIGQIDNAFTNPQEGYSKAIFYDVIQDIMPSTRGNLLEIRKAQYSNDPETRMKIQRAMFNRLTSIYGGIDTTSGYLAMSQFTGIQNPEELQKWVNQIRRGLPTVSKGNPTTAGEGLKGYTQEVSKQMLKYQDQTVAAISENLSNLSGVADTMLKTFRKQLDEIIRELAKANK